MLIACTGIIAIPVIASNITKSPVIQLKSAKAPAVRLVSLAPHITELIFAAGAGDLLQGVSSFSDFPPAARTLPVVGNFAALDFEQLVAMQPDLVIAWQSGNAERDVEKLRRLNIRVYVLALNRLEDIPQALRSIGTLTNREISAEAAAYQFEQTLAELTAIHNRTPPLKVFYEIWHEPLMTISGAHSISSVIRHCGGINIFAQLNSLTPRVSLEDILQLQPDAIFSPRPLGEAMKFWGNFPSIKAVEAGHIYSISPDLLHRPTPRILQGTASLCQALDAIVSPRPNAAIFR